MRSSWRLIRRVSYTCLTPLYSNSTCVFQLHSSSTKLASSEVYNREIYCFSTNLLFRGFSSESVEKSNFVSVVSDLFENDFNAVDIEKKLESERVILNDGVVLDVLKALCLKPNVARRFFSWALEKDSRNIGESGYNLMLEIYCSNGLINEFWDLIEIMNKKGFSIGSATRDKAMELFSNDGRLNDLEKLNAVFSEATRKKELMEVSLKVSKIVKNRAWGPDAEEEIRGLDVDFSGDFLRVVLDKLGTDPMKALIFFRWVEEMVKHDGKSYNAMARVLGREDCIDRFWKLIEEMKINGFELEPNTYSNLLGRFVKRKMMNDAVKLMEYSMTCKIKPSVRYCNFLLKKIASRKDFDVELFSKLVKITTQRGKVLTNGILDSAVKSLTKSGRLDECNRVVVELMNAGMVLDGDSQSKVALALCSRGLEPQVTEFLNLLENSGTQLDEKGVVSIIEGYCLSENLDKALHFFHENYSKLEPSNSCNAFHILAHTYCSKNRALEVFKIMQNCINENQIRPFHKTYKTLIRSLLVQGGFNEALICIDGMRKNGYSLIVNPFIEYLCKCGTDDEADAFIKAVTCKKNPSTYIPRLTLQAFLSAGKSTEAHNLLGKCDRRIRYHPDILSVLVPRGNNTVAA